MSGYKCIMELVEHMTSETKQIFKGTTHENDCKWYHDALSLMTAAETIEWMKQTGHYNMWILPLNGLQEDAEDTKRYKGRPVGNTPEVMSWDELLNKDVHECVKQHCRQTREYDSDDEDERELKFSLATPKKGSHAYLHLLDLGTGPIGITPPEYQIIHDHDGTIQAWEDIRQVKGGAFIGQNNQNNQTSGRRGAAGGVTNSNWGGAQQRKLAEDDYGTTKVWHEDAKLAVDRKKLKSKSRYQGPSGSP